MSYYCGIGKIPKNKIRGNASNCKKMNQIRYYGIEKIKPKILTETKMKKYDYNKEAFKLKKLEEDAKLLIRNINYQKIIISKSTGTKLNNAKKKLNTLLSKKNGLIKKLKTQNDLILTSKPNKNKSNKINGGCHCEDMNDDKYEKYYDLGKEIGDIINKNNDGLLLSALIKGLMKD